MLFFFKAYSKNLISLTNYLRITYSMQSGKNCAYIKASIDSYLTVNLINVDW